MRRAGRGLGDHDEILAANLLLVKAECLANAPLDAVSSNSRRRCLLGHSKAEPGSAAVILDHQNGEVAIRYAASAREHSRVFGRSGQARGTGVVAELLLHPPFNLRRQTGPTFRAPPRQHLTAGFGRHARPKTVGALAPDHTRLKRPLHAGIRPAAIL